MSTLIEQKWPGEFIVSEDNGTRSRENIILAMGNSVNAGDALGKITVAVAAPVAAATAGNTGNGTFGVITDTAGIAAGVYNVTFLSATRFTVEGPTGVTLGEGTTGVAFALGGLNFTITAGATAFVVGDAFTVTVSAGTAKYAALNPAAADGSANFAAFAGQTINATAADANTWALVRSAEVNGAEVSFGTLAGAQLAAAKAQAAAQGLIIRSAI